jgi:hypothetical protein
MLGETNVQQNPRVERWGPSTGDPVDVVMQDGRATRTIA